MTGYHIARAVVARTLGALLVCCGICVAGGVLLESTGWRSAGWCVLGLALGFAALAVLAAIRLLRTSPVLLFDRSGYAVSGLRGVGARSAAWKDVSGVSRSGDDRRPVVRIRLRDGRATTLPTWLIEEPPSSWLVDMEARLNTAHGQRRLR